MFELSFIPDIDASLLAGFITLYAVEWVVIKTRDKYDIILGLYGVTILLYIPFMIWGSNPDAYKGFGLLLGMALAMYLNSKMIERTFHLSVEQRLVFVLTTAVVMIVLFNLFGILFTVLSEDDSILRNILDAIRFFGVLLFGLHEYPKYFFMILNRSG